MEFIEAYEEHVWDVYGFLAYRARSSDAAEELTQETFERALRGWPRFDPARGDAKSWLLVIARNAYIDSQRRATSRPERAVEPERLEALAGGEGGGVLLRGPDPDLATALSRLKRREREALALRFGGDLKIAEVAAALGVSVASAQQIISRALKRLRSILGSRPATTSGHQAGPGDD